MPSHGALPRAGQFAAGVSLLVIALAASGLGLTLNVSHGLETSIAAAVAFGLADGAKIVVPLVAGLIGWSKHMRATALVCVLASLWAASNAYLDAAGRELLAKEHGQTVYADADRRISELEAEAASLRDLAEKEGVRGGCKINCQTIINKAENSAQRLHEARQARAALSPVEASGLTAMVAMIAGGNAGKIARWLGAVKAALFILLVEALVWLAVPAMRLLSAAFRRRCSDVITFEPIPEVNPTPAKITARAGTAAYYHQRLNRDFPQLAQAVDRGELSVFAASVQAGLRKPPRERLLLLTQPDLSLAPDEQQDILSSSPQARAEALEE
jgi:hypothetical protein